MPTINDPNGKPLRINEKGFGLVIAVAMHMSAHAGDDGDAYTMVVSNDPNAATADFVYIKNESDAELRIYKIKGYTTAADNTITIKTGVTGTPTGGTDVVPINNLVGCGKLAEGTFQVTDGAQSMALTGGDTIDTLFLDKDFVGEQVWDYPAEISIEKNQTFCMYAASDPTANLEFTIYFYYHEKIE